MAATVQLNARLNPTLEADECLGDTDGETSMGWSIIEEVFASHGLRYSPSPLTISDDDLLERELLERL